MSLFQALGPTWGRRLHNLVEHPAMESRWLILAGLLILLIPVWLIITVPLSMEWQWMFGIGTFLIAMWLRRVDGHLVSIVMMVMSVLASSRYMYWRFTESIGIGLAHRDALDLFFALGLVAAEIYAFLVLLLGFFQVLWPLNRKPVPLPRDSSQWPTVDIYVPTYNEPMKVVRPTVLAALEMDWPADKLNVYVLDDGRRDEFREFCEEVGATHITRPDSKHAKAGNINRCLQRTNGDFIAIFDCDHVPTRSFLQVALGAFVADPKLALVQTPHHFFSPDPFERNLGTFRKVPNEGELFYGLLQDGNDFWDAAFFCGSCAVIRREAVMQVGGIAVETVTEDAHTSLKMHSLGWRSAYINIPQAAGLATESLSAHVGQRIRWARGMAQIFRTDNPLFKRGLKLGQRLCYANAMLHFFYGLPRIVFLTAPLSYLFFEAHIIESSALVIAAYAAPHLVLANLTNSRLQGPFRHSFWAEVYESVLATYILVPTLLALINPKLGTFNVTAKGGLVADEYFDRDIARPYLILLTLNISGLVVGFFRLFFWNTHEVDTVVLNLGWTVYNILIVGAALCVAWESKQIRSSIRVRSEVSAQVEMPDGRIIPATTIDLSEGGTAVKMVRSEKLEVGDTVRVALVPEYREVWMPSKVTRSAGDFLAMQFSDMDLMQEKQLIYAIFGRADAWVRWSDERPVDQPGLAFREVLQFGLLGINRIMMMGAAFVRQSFKRIVQYFLGERTAKGLGSVALAIAAGLLMAPSAVDAQASGNAQVVARSGTTDLITQAESRTLTLEQLGIRRPIRLRGVTGEAGFNVAVRDDEVVSRARLNLNFSHSPSLIFKLSHLNVLVNNELAATIPLSERTAGGSTHSIDIDPRLFVQYNQISLQLIAHYTLDCEDPVHTSLWAIVSNRSTLELDTKPLSLANDLNLLPSPFFDPRDSRRLNLPFVFASEPNLQEMEAAGVVASWFGAKAAYRGARFPTFIDRLPPGHGVVFVQNGDAPAGLDLDPTNAARISVIDNPRTPTAKLLVVQGSDGQALNMAARALALGSEALAGQSTVIREFTEPAPREPYDAPRWIPTDRAVQLGELTEPWELEVSGLYPGPIKVNFSVPPDLFTWRKKGLKLDLKYRYTPTVGSKSTLNVNINDEFVEAIALSFTGEDDASADRINLPFVAQYEAVNEGTVYIPDYKWSSDNVFQFQYYFERKKEGACKDVILDNLRGVIDEDSEIDLSSFPHYTFLPELSLFANGGYPFTRMADLSETAVVLPNELNEHEISSYLAVMGRLGNATGYPAIRFGLGRASDVDAFSDHDILVLGSANSQPLLAQWADYMPMSVSGGQTRLRVIGPIERLRARWEGRDLGGALDHAGRVVLEAGQTLGAIMSFESPLAEDRTVVVLTAGDSNRLLDVANVFTEAGKVQYIFGDLVLLNGDELNHYQLGPQYSVGSLPWYTALHWWFANQPLLLVVFIVLIALFVAIVTFRLLRRMALARKEGRA